MCVELRETLNIFARRVKNRKIYLSGVFGYDGKQFLLGIKNDRDGMPSEIIFDKYDFVQYIFHDKCKVENIFIRCFW